MIPAISRLNNFGSLFIYNSFISVCRYTFLIIGKYATALFATRVCGHSANRVTTKNRKNNKHLAKRLLFMSVIARLHINKKHIDCTL